MLYIFFLLVKYFRYICQLLLKLIDKDPNRLGMMNFIYINLSYHNNLTHSLTLTLAHSLSPLSC
jgi:hypothetical protein